MLPMNDVAQTNFDKMLQTQPEKIKAVLKYIHQNLDSEKIFDWNNYPDIVIEPKDVVLILMAVCNKGIVEDSEVRDLHSIHFSGPFGLPSQICTNEKECLSLAFAKLN